MKRLLCCFLLAGFLCPAFAQYNSENLKIGYQEYASELTFGNLRIYPILANGEFVAAHKGIGKYKTLETALENEDVTISEQGSGPDLNNVDILNERNEVNEAQVQEVGGGGTVNSLMIKNDSKDTVFIMAGEVIKGGKQDRVIAQDLKIPPNSGQVDLSVFCVEHGRWSYGGDADGKFKGHAKISSMNVRKAAIKERDQQAVWDSVASITKKNGAQSSTGTYNELEKSKKLQKELEEYVSHFSNLPYKGTNVVGMVGVTGGKIIGCDMFATHDLFKSQYKNLLYAYSTEAITNGEKVTIPETEVSEYLAELLDESKQEEFVKTNGLLFRDASEKTLHINTYSK